MTISLILKWDPQGRLGWELAVVTGVSHEHQNLQFRYAEKLPQAKKHITLQSTMDQGLPDRGKSLERRGSGTASAPVAMSSAIFLIP